MIGIIDYGAGNLRSLSNALRTLAIPHVISSDRTVLGSCGKIILPGVGEAQSAMTALRKFELFDWLQRVSVPMLGICLGMQLLYERSTERDTYGLGIVRGIVERFPGGPNVKVPHMGWNDVSHTESHPLFVGIPSGAQFYFVHSYHAPITEDCIGETEHGVRFASAVSRGNFFGVQFHPEKSGGTGLHLLRNFVEQCS
jgi:glutamine amidotransferase